MTHRKQAEALAIQLAVDKLAAQTDLTARCARLGLPDPETAHGAIRLPLFGQTVELRPPAFEGVAIGTGLPPKPADRLLALHYLLCDRPVAPEGRWITFRDFPGGAFYWQPFLARSIQPLVKAIGNDPELLRTRLARFAGTIEAGPADALSARIAAVGRIAVLLVYRAGDAEFPATADLLYDACARRVYGAEDAAVLGGRICLGLL